MKNVLPFNFLQIALNFIQSQATKNKTFLVVGARASKCYFFNKKSIFFIEEVWANGLLTNWKTTQEEINKLIKLENSLENNKIVLKNLSFQKEKIKKLNSYFGGIKKMVKLPDIVIFFNSHLYLNAIKECNKLGISTIGLITQNVQIPNLIMYPIPMDLNSEYFEKIIIKYLLKYINN
jgi:small subunit ribosomal protein S2